MAERPMRIIDDRQSGAAHAAMDEETGGYDAATRCTPSGQLNK
jgi:hypothetical protein